MHVTLKPISEQVIVITGASSGIGLATAQAAAAAGAKVVLTARTESALAAAVEQIRAEGGTAVYAVADVAQREELARVARTAVDHFSRIDTWVNNAGVGIWSTIEETSEQDMRRLFETNFWGQVHGSVVALPYLRTSGGALINVGSMVSDRALPMQGIYSASKQALKGFTDALRMELAHENAPISVTLVKPGSIGTPMPQHVKNYTGHEAKFPAPVYAPEDVAAVILHVATHPTRDAFVGGSARMTAALAHVVPGMLDWLSQQFLVEAQLGPKPATPGDNLHHGRSEARVRGDHQGSMIRPSGYTHAKLHPGLLALGLGAAVLGLAAASQSARS